jgi:hypothetical protein
MTTIVVHRPQARLSARRHDDEQNIIGANSSARISLIQTEVAMGIAFDCFASLEQHISTKFLCIAETAIG